MARIESARLRGARVRIEGFVVGEGRLDSQYDYSPIQDEKPNSFSTNFGRDDDDLCHQVTDDHPDREVSIQEEQDPK